MGHKTNILITDALIKKFEVMSNDIKTYMNISADYGKAINESVEMGKELGQPFFVKVKMLDDDEVGEIIEIRNQLKTLVSKLKNKYNG